MYTSTCLAIISPTQFYVGWGQLVFYATFPWMEAKSSRSTSPLLVVLNLPPRFPAGEFPCHLAIIGTLPNSGFTSQQIICDQTCLDPEIDM